MGVPAFYRWLSEKYPKIVIPAREIEAQIVNGTEIPVDASEPNPNGYEFDNLYLDMNGLIHPCTHPEGEEAPPTEEDMYTEILKYIDRLFALIRPRKVLYMAIDGVAPRAKMNQQRSRRFRSAQEAQEAEEDAERLRLEIIQNGRKPPPSKPKPWDSNVITPGTPFMTTLAKCVRHYILQRQTYNKAWKNVKVIFSDAQCPGEGEHKIMQFIRRQRTEPGYNPNTTHCLYGLDADLIMLGLATHEIHFTILREQVLFGKKKHAQSYSQDAVLLDKNNPGARNGESIAKKKKPFDLLRLWILREYLAHELRREAFYLPFLSFDYNFERCIDDFVYLCFFVGNDFLPHLPSMSIREGGLELIIDLYKRLLPTLGGYITEDGDVDLGRAEVVFKLLGSVEDEIFKRRRANELWLQQRRQNNKLYNNNKNNNTSGSLYSAFALTSNSKKNRKIVEKPPEEEFIALGKGRDKRKHGSSSGVAAPSADANKEAAAALRQSIVKKKHKANTKHSNSKGEESVQTNPALIEEDLSLAAKKAFQDQVKELEKKRNIHDNVVDHVRLGEEGWKERYYISKFGAENGVDPAFRRKMVEEYVIGLCWVMNYYYKGCQSWKWFYPYHYAPFASDLTNLAEIKVVFPPSRPFRPIEQLLGVFPAASAHALPKPFRWYMTDEDSPIADFYPRNFEYDPNGKGVRWLWIALLPFIDEERLLKVVREVEPELSAEQKRLNECSPDLIFINVNSKGAIAMQENAGAFKKSETRSLLDSVNNGDTPKTAGDVRYGNKDCGRVIGAEETDGVSGFFLPPPEDFLVVAGDDVHCENDSLDPVENNQSISFEFRNAPMKPHLSYLLNGVKIPDPILNEQDLRIRKPRLSRGVDVSNLLGEQSHNNMHNSSHGGQAPDVLSQSGMQREWGGQRSWGSMEPRANRKTWRRNYNDNNGPPNQQYIHPSYGQHIQQQQRGHGENQPRGYTHPSYNQHPYQHRGNGQNYPPGGAEDFRNHQYNYRSQSQPYQSSQNQIQPNPFNRSSFTSSTSMQQQPRQNPFHRRSQPQQENPFNQGRSQQPQNPFGHGQGQQQQPGMTAPTPTSTLDQIRANFNNMQRRR